jgi:hypothetical protein
MHEFLEGLLHIRDVDQVWILLGLIGVDVGLTWMLRKKYCEAADSACSVAMGLAYAATIAISAGTVLAALYWLRQYAVFDIDWAGSALLILAAFVIIDFLFYWYHRAIHEIRFGWAAHVNHHSSLGRSRLWHSLSAQNTQSREGDISRMGRYCERPEEGAKPP